MPYGYPQLLDPGDNCFICNRPIDFADGWEFAVSWSSVLPRGSTRPSAMMWVHVECANRVAHPDYAIRAADSPDQDRPRA